MKGIKILFFVSILIFSLSSNSISQNVTIGDSTYATLKEAFDAINSGMHTGNITVYIVNNTTETSTAILHDSGYGAASYDSVKVKPLDSAYTVSGSIVGALIKLSGTRRVTIDGRLGGSGRNLTFINKVTTNFDNSVIWISDRNTSPEVITGAERNIIRNCNIHGDVDQSATIFGLYGIVISGLTTVVGSSTLEGTDNDYNMILDNYIYKCMRGIIVSGSSTNLNDSNVISNNLIGSASFDSDRLSGTGIGVDYQNNCVIESNEIRNAGSLISESVTGSTEKIGIAVGSYFWNLGGYITEGKNCRVNGNYIHDLIDDVTGESAIGIAIATSEAGLSTDNIISNNVIYNVRSVSSFITAGIAHDGGYGDKIVHNSIYLYGSLYLASEGAHGIRVLLESDTALVIKNNSIYLDYTYTGTSTILRSYCITMPSSTYKWGTGGCNFNDYYFLPSNTKMKIGGIGTSSLFTPFSTMPMWRFVFTPMQDLMSFSDDPKYTSATYLFPLSSSPLLGAGTPIAGVTKDILGSPRSPFTPSIGAYETDSSTLPVELISFSSSVNGRDVSLSWTTVSEINNAGFEIERSNISGQMSGDWMKIGFVNGNGISVTPRYYTFADRGLAPGKYGYRLKQIDYNGQIAYYNLNNEVNIGIPQRFDLSQNYPNPFNPMTIINYQLSMSNFVSLKIYDLAGKEIRKLVKGKQEAGYYSVEFDGSNLSSGVYFYRIEIGDFIATRRMLLLK